MRGVAVAVVVAAVAVAGVGAAGTQETPTTTRERAQLSFGGSDPLKVKWADLRKGVRVEVFNETPRALTVTVQLTDFAAEKGAGRFTPIQLAAALNPAESLDLPPGQSKRVTIKAARAKPPPDDTYTGSVVAFVQGGGPFARRTIALTVATTAKSEAKPLVDALTVNVYRLRWPFLANRWWSWGRYRGRDDIVLPLKATADVDVAALKELGAIKKGGTVATVNRDGDAKKIDGHYGLPVKLDGLGDPGEYEGKLDLLPDDDKAGEVTLEVVYSDTIWLPLLVLLAGVGAGWLLSRALGVTVRYLDLRVRLALIRRALEKAQPKFRAIAGDKDWNDYDLNPAVDEAEAKFRERIDALRATHLVAIPDAEATTLNNELDAARKTVDSFGTTFPTSLQKLDTTLAAIEAGPSGPVPDLRNKMPPDRPAIYAELKPLLRGEKLLDLDAFKTLAQTVGDGNDGAVAWRKCEDEISRALIALELCRPPEPEPGEPAPGAPKFDGAADDLDSVYRDLWERTTAAEAKADTLKQQFDVLWRKIDEAREEAEDRATAEGAVTETLGMRAKHAPPEAGSAADEEVIGPDDEAADFEHKRDWTRRMLVGAAIAVALVTGLNSLYVGKGFGTTWDYINLFAWGVTTKLVFDLVVNSLDALNLVRVARR